MMVAALLLAASQAKLPQFTVKFVDLNGWSVYEEIEIKDARRDLSLAGRSYFRMINDVHSSPVSILRGRPVGMLREEQGSDPEGTQYFWIQRLLGGDRATAIHADDQNPEQGHPVVVVSKRGKWELFGASDTEMPGPGRVEAKIQELAQTPEWAKAYVNKWSKPNIEDRVGSWTFKMPFATLVNFWHYAIPNSDTPSFMCDTHRTVFLSKANRVVPLSQCVLGGSTLDYSEIVWASPEGWFVVRASKGEHDGFAWLYPVKKAHGTL